ncbi:MAG: isochorismate synthase [Candidatus Accumulibacter sp.]|jgi:isochorismate synthase|uniref:isochorismate synthase n=1 Tax=unclassified Candidatus Accumulibacter TaxID=2619054 RepID=UPI0012CA652F|nr:MULTISPECIES: isochorismate synthase [unclassified Candidatus Accumulibacter]MBL8367497.1 isochorismate synthase [Accumulibacter sp.]MQM33815.1 isochorismate synthase [Candidatus Accumulibacter phosphatis]
MNLAELLDGPRRALLRRRLRARLPRAAARGLLSVTLDLGAGGEQRWLDGDLARAQLNWWARPAGAAPDVAAGDGREAVQRSGAHGDYRLAVGSAMSFTSTGAARFAALQAAFSGLAPVWEHDDWQQTGFVPLAHIGFAFDEDAGNGASTADELPNARLLVPAVLLANRAGRCSATFSCAVGEGEGAIDRWRDALRAVQPPDWTAAAAPPASVVRRRSEVLAERAFLARARAALAEIAGGRLAKLVLARSVRFDGDRPIALAPLLAALADRHPECAIFGVGERGQFFLGATPERLVALRRGVVEADALAGTAWLAAVSAAGEGRSLTLQDDKNTREQQLVVDAVRTALAPLCVALAAPTPAEVLQLRELQHLRTRVRGRLHPGVGLFDVVARLHPTPAVGGTPAGAARQWLRSHGDRRGAWYSGGVGWIDRDGDGEVVVALRCARIKGCGAELFAGAGIVAGSDPAQELAETEAKLAVIAEALRQALPAVHRPESRSA